MPDLESNSSSESSDFSDSDDSTESDDFSDEINEPYVPETERQAWMMSVHKIFEEITFYQQDSKETPMQCFSRFKSWFRKLGDVFEQMCRAEELDTFKPDEHTINLIQSADETAWYEFQRSCARSLYDVLSSSDCESEASDDSDSDE